MKRDGGGREENFHRQTFGKIRLEECCILTLGRARCFNCVNKVIAGRPCLNRKAAMSRVSTSYGLNQKCVSVMKLHIYTLSNAQSQSCSQKIFCQLPGTTLGEGRQPTTVTGSLQLSVFNLSLGVPVWPQGTKWSLCKDQLRTFRQRRIDILT